MELMKPAKNDPMHGKSKMFNCKTYKEHGNMAIYTFFLLIKNSE